MHFELEQIVREFDSSYEKAVKAASNRPWARPAHLPDHPRTHSDRHPDDPEHFELFMVYFA
jgi:hypothetical protein